MLTFESQTESLNDKTFDQGIDSILLNSRHPMNI